MLVSTRYGFDMIIDPVDEAVSRSILDKGTWQPELIHVMVMFIQPGQTFLNLGTQTGLEAVILGKIVGNSGHLYLFEPSSVSYRILLKNIFINDLEDITHAYRVGAGESQS
jgi:predicted O-methyltransferase YrrM